jgi:predicted Zn-ribbon and HTH transcriptional regulator
MTLTINTLQCVKCGVELRSRTTRPTKPDPCPICLTDTVIIVSTRRMNDPVQVPDRRT